MATSVTRNLTKDLMQTVNSYQSKGVERFIYSQNDNCLQDPVERINTNTFNEGNDVISNDKRITNQSLQYSPQQTPIYMTPKEGEMVFQHAVRNSNDTLTFDSGPNRMIKMSNY